MKRFATFAAIVAAAVGGYVAPQAANMPTLIEPPKATAIVVSGPEEGFAGRDYFFTAAMRGDHGRPTWIVSPECDLSVNDDGTIARLRCDEPALYTLTVTVGGKDASVAATMAHFEAIDLENEINQAVAQATAVAEPQGPTIAQLVLASHVLPDKSLWSQAAGKIRLMADRINNGLIPRDSNPLLLLRGELGQDWFDFFEDFAVVAEQLKASGQLTDVASYAPVLEEIAGALSQ